ncbi:MAG: SIS domain-containing protein [Nanoarchaeota archaeon]
MDNNLDSWVAQYLKNQQDVYKYIPVDKVLSLIETLRNALKENKQIFVCGNGGSASNISHFACDLGKGASDKISKRFRIISLNENIAWMTAIGNDYVYEDIFVRQLENYAQSGDILLVASVSGNSPNVVKAIEWAKTNELHTIALVGGKKGRLTEIADKVIVINSDHYGVVEDAQMTICHILCYAFIENPSLGNFL